MKSKRLPDGQVKLEGKFWPDIFPESERPKWIAFYDKMFSQYGYSGYKTTADG